MINTGHQAKPFVDAGIEILRIPLDVFAAHEAQQLAVADVEEEVLHDAALAELDEVRANQRKAEYVLVERARGFHILGAEVDVVEAKSLVHCVLR